MITYSYQGLLGGPGTCVEVSQNFWPCVEVLFSQKSVFFRNYRDISTKIRAASVGGHSLGKIFITEHPSWDFGTLPPGKIFDYNPWKFGKSERQQHVRTWVTGESRVFSLGSDSWYTGAGAVFMALVSWQQHFRTLVTGESGVIVKVLIREVLLRNERKYNWLKKHG